MRNLLFLFIVAVVNLCAYAQASLDEIAAAPGKAGGVYYAYPEPEILQTPAPAGYKPFYISHYGRHGSRYLISDNDYTAPRDILRRAADADALTPLGRDILSRLDSVWIEAQGRGGELSPLGVRQHRGIAHLIPAGFRCNRSLYSLFHSRDALCSFHVLVCRRIESLGAISCNPMRVVAAKYVFPQLSFPGIGFLQQRQRSVVSVMAPLPSRADTPGAPRCKHLLRFVVGGNLARPCGVYVADVLGCRGYAKHGN